MIRKRSIFIAFLVLCILISSYLIFKTNILHELGEKDKIEINDEIATQGEDLKDDKLPEEDKKIQEKSEIDVITFQIDELDIIDEIIIEKSEHSIILSSSTGDLLISSNKRGTKLDFHKRYTEKGTVFFHYDVVDNQLEKLFAVKGNDVIGEIVNDGEGLVYTDEYLRGQLFYLEKDHIEICLLKHCNWYSVSPDRRKVFASGLSIDDENSDEFKLYLFHVEKKSLEEIPGLKGPGNWEELLTFYSGWSSDSRHFFVKNKIVDTNQNRIIKDLTVNDKILSRITWSPDGNKLAFILQSPMYSEYYIVFENDCEYLSDRLGVYDLSNHTIEYYEFKEELIYDFVWRKDSKEIVAETVPFSHIDVFIKNKNTWDHIDPLVSYVNLKQIHLENKNVTDLLNSYSNNENKKDFDIIKSRLFTEDTLFLARENGDMITESVYYISNRMISDLPQEDRWFTIILNEEKIFLIGTEGVYSIDEDLNITKHLELRNHYYSLDFIEYNKIVLKWSEYQYTGNNIEYIEIINLF